MKRISHEDDLPWSAAAQVILEGKAATHEDNRLRTEVAGVLLERLRAFCVAADAACRFPLKRGICQSDGGARNSDLQHF